MIFTVIQRVISYWNHQPTEVPVLSLSLFISKCFHTASKGHSVRAYLDTIKNILGKGWNNYIPDEGRMQLALL